MAGKKLKVVELFAGVGGFRLGLEEHNKYEVVWSNQWEPQTKTQHASLIYEDRFGPNGHSSEDILMAYPYLESEDLQEALSYAAWGVEEV